MQSAKLNRFRLTRFMIVRLMIHDQTYLNQERLNTSCDATFLNGTEFANDKTLYCKPSKAVGHFNTELFKKQIAISNERKLSESIYVHQSTERFNPSLDVNKKFQTCVQLTIEIESLIDMGRNYAQQPFLEKIMRQNKVEKKCTPT